MPKRLFKCACLGVIGLALATTASPADAGGYAHYGHSGHYHGGGNDDWAYGLFGGLIGLGLGIALSSYLNAPKPVYVPPPVYPPPPSYSPPPSYTPPSVYTPPSASAPQTYSTFAPMPSAVAAPLRLQPASVPTDAISAVPTSQVYLSSSGAYCRDFKATGLVGGVTRPIAGTACQGADGVWRVVR
jgi:hypothetical protein